jgi:NADP-dependent 3-hydroxy acid dehydrogenase YdfG
VTVDDEHHEHVGGGEGGVAATRTSLEGDRTGHALSGQVALVTGASGGIGAAIAGALAREGAAVFLVARGRERLEAVARTIAGAGGPSRVSVCPADLRKQADVDQLRVALGQEAGRLDILVHSAGAYARGAVKDATSSEFDDLYAANLRGPFLLTKAVLSLLENSRGQVIFINSSSGVRAPALVSQFSATQHALRALGDALREEVNGNGVRVLTMHLGRTATQRTERLHEQEAKPYRPSLLMQPEDVASMAIAALRLPRTAEVTEIHMRPLVKSY